VNKFTKPGEHPHNRTLMVSASGYYRQRADIGRGMHKRDMPSDAKLPISEEVEKTAAELTADPKTP
jgi:hypothetical protein